MAIFNSSLLDRTYIILSNALLLIRSSLTSQLTDGEFLNLLMKAEKALLGGAFACRLLEDRNMTDHERIQKFLELIDT